MLEALSYHYGLPIEESIQNLCDQFQQFAINETDFRDRYLALLKELDDPNKRFVIRFHPVHLAARRDKSFSLDQILDFDSFNFQQYDKIYVTTRSPVDRVCSLFVASETGLWTFTKTSVERPLINLPPKSIVENSGVIRKSITDDIIYEKLEEHFKKKSIDYESVDYDNMVSFAKENGFPVRSVNHVETHYDYTKMISNYSDLEGYIKAADLDIRTKLGLL